MCVYPFDSEKQYEKFDDNTYENQAIIKYQFNFKDLIKIPIEIIITTDTKSNQYFALKNGI